MDSTGSFALLQVGAILFNGLVELGCVLLIVFRSKNTQRFCYNLMCRDLWTT